MADDERIVSADLLRPVFRARALIHAFGALIGLMLVVAGDAGPALLGFVLATLVVAVYQVRDCSVYGAWAVDTSYAVGLAFWADSLAAPAIIVGWATVVGLFDTEERWIFPVAAAAAGAVCAAVLSMNLLDDGVRAIAHGGAVGAAAGFFVIAFRMVGRLLRQGNRELRSFFERIPVALTRTSPSGQLLEFNAATALLFDSPQVGEQVTARYVDPETRQEFVRELERHGYVRNFEARMQRGPDDTIDAVISANAVVAESGELRFIESALFDFTPLRALEAERERLARVIDSTSDLVAIGDWDGSVTYANPAARAWLRRYVTDDEYVDLNLPVTGADQTMITEALRRDGSWIGVLTIPGRDKARTVSASLQRFAMGGKLTVALIARDVTDEVETERQLKDLIRAKDELVASISHEIRTPLSVVLGLATELRDGYADFDGPTHREFASLIAEQGQEMANIVEDLLVAARADTGSIVLVLGAVDLRDEVEAALRAVPESGAVVVTQQLAKTCWGDASRIRQILRNLISNAQRYGGENISIATHQKDDVAVVEVSDDGPGVPKGETTTIFQPFRSAHAAGTQPASIGLGLSVSRDLARRMGGDVVYRRQGGQTTFSLVLPLSPPRSNVPSTS